LSVEIRLLMPRRMYEALRRRAEREKTSLEEVILEALARIFEEEEAGGGG